MPETVPLIVHGQVFALHLSTVELSPERFYSVPKGLEFRVLAESATRMLDRPPATGDDELLESIPDKDYALAAESRARFVCLNLLEVFFAHFFSNVQCPWAPGAWLSTYSSKKLPGMVSALLAEPWEYDELTFPLSNPRGFLGHLFGVYALHASDDEKLAEIAAIEGIVDVLAREFTRPSVVAEYNAIKHGARGRPAAVKFEATPKRMVDGEMVYGESVVLRSPHARGAIRAPSAWAAVSRRGPESSG